MSSLTRRLLFNLSELAAHQFSCKSEQNWDGLEKNKVIAGVDIPYHGQTFLTLQESLLTNFQLIRKDIVDPPPIQGYPSSKPSVSGSYTGSATGMNGL